MKSICTLAVLLMAGAAFVSCTKDEEPEPAASQTYTMTVNASKGGDNATKHLDLDGTTLTATWAEGEAVTVYNVTKSATLTGTLTAQSSGASTTLKGTLTGTIENGDELLLKFLSPTYSGQNGTLDYIAAHCDYAEATVTVTDASTSSVTTTHADFTNQQAIIKFTLKKSDGTALPCNPEALRVSDGTNTIVMTGIPGSTYSNEKNGNGVLYVAMPGFSDKTVIIDAYCNEKLYTYTRANVSFANSSYYAITVKMSPATNVDLARVISNLELQDDNTVTGTLGSIVRVSVASGATVTLNNATINGTNSGWRYAWGGLHCKGNATVVLADGTTNTLRGSYDYPGIYVSNGNTVTIQGTGTLNASSNGDGAGIGGGWSLNCGNILIKGGTINATGGSYAAGIGSGFMGSCGNIEIQGGTVTANGANYAAGIGTGHGEEMEDFDIDPETDMPMPNGNFLYHISTCGTITISGGTVVATGGDFAAGIGTGEIGNCGNITITSDVTRVTATKGFIAQHSIGRGDDGINFQYYCEYEDFSVTIGGSSVGYISTSPYTYQP